MYKYKCSWCSKEFETDNIDQEYCSIECFHAEEEEQDINIELNWEAEHEIDGPP